MAEKPDPDPTALTLELNLTRKDFTRFARYIVWRRHGPASLLVVGLYALLGFVGGGALLDQGLQPAVFARSGIVWLTTLATTAIAITLRELHIHRLVALNQSHQRMGGGPNMTLHIDAQGLTTRDELETLEVKWKGVNELLVTPTDFYVSVGLHRYVIVPRRVFGRPGQDEEFLRALEGHQRRQGSPPTFSAPGGPALR